MKEFLNKLKMPAIIGVVATLGGGTLNYIIRSKTGVHFTFGSVFKNFLVVTVAATAVEYGRDEKSSIER